MCNKGFQGIPPFLPAYCRYQNRQYPWNGGSYPMGDGALRISITRCIYGMACEKYHALFHEYPSNKEKIEKYGYDSKQLHHLLRLQYFISDYFEFLMGRRTYKGILTPSYEDREYLISIKTYERVYSIDKVKLLADGAMEYIKDMKDFIINKYNI